MHKKTWQIYLVAIACLLLRSPQNALTPRLWAEDAIFLMQAVGSPFLSLLWPDQGYLHVYQRIAALLAQEVPVACVPVFFALAWLLAFLASVTVINQCLRRLGLTHATALLTVALITLQPSTTEAFFTLTNAQWWTGVALIFYICTPWDKALSRLELSVALLCCLTGPFSVLMLPVLALRAVLLRDYRSHRSFYLVVVLGAAVQIAFLLFFPRSIGAAAMDRDPQHWLYAAGVFLTFSHLAGGGLLWLVLAWESARLYPARHDAATRERWRVTLLLGLSIILAVAGGYLAAKDRPQLLSPLGYWSRYFITPYTLLFLMAMYVCRPLPRCLATLAMIMLCAEALAAPAAVDAKRENLQWEAYLRLARQLDGVMIPINPLQGRWHLQGNALFPGVRNPPAGFRVDLASVKTGITTSHIDHGFMTITPGKAAAQLQFDIGGQCRNDRYLGVVANVYRTMGGFTALHWSSGGVFSEQNSLLGFYSANWVDMKFAFARAPGDINDTLENASESILDRIQVYCLGS